MKIEPVEIEYLMKDNASEGMGDLGDAAVSVGEKFEKSSADIKKQLKEQKDLVKFVEGELKELEKAFQTAAPGQQWMETKSEIEACKKALAEERATLKYVEEQYEKTAASGKKLSMQLRELYDDMAKMRLEGKQNTDEYRALEQQAAQLADTLGDVRTQTSILAHDNAGLQGVISGATGAAGAMTTATGVFALFAGQNEDLIKIQTKLQAVMAITMGLQQVMNTLNKDSAFRLVTVRKAKDMLTAATGRLSVALGISNVMAKALMATLTLGLSVAIGAVIALWDKFSSKQKQAKKEFEDFTDKVASGAASTISHFQTMVAEWEKLGDSLEEKKKYIEENQDAFAKLGVKINDVVDAENLFNDGREAFIESVMLKAKAAAAMEMAAEKYKVAIEKMMKAEQMPETVTRYVGTGYGPVYTYEVENNKRVKAMNQANAAEAEGNAYILRALDFGQEATQTLADAGLSPAEEIIEGSVAAIEQTIAARRKALKDITNPEEYQQAVKLIELEQQKLDQITGANKKTTGNTTQPTVKNNLADLEAQAQRRIDDQVVALMEEGYEKQRAAAQLAFEREKERIAKEEAEKLELFDKLRAAGADVDDRDREAIIAQAATLRVQAGALYDKALSEIVNKEEKDERERVQRLLQPYMDFADRRLEIEEKYRKDMEELRAMRTDENAEQIDRALAQAARNRAQEYEQLDREITDSARRSSAILESIFSDAAKQPNSLLQKSIEDAEELLKVLRSDQEGDALGFTAEQIAAMRRDGDLIEEIIQGIIDKKNELYDRGGLVSQFVASFKKIKEALSLDDPEQRMDGLANGIEGMLGAGQAINSVFGSVGDSLARIAELSGDEGLAGAAYTIQGIADTLGSAMSGAQAGMAIGGPWGAAIGAVVGAATSLFSMAAEANARHKAALKEIEEAKIAYQRKYNLLLLEQKLLMEEASNIFGERQIAKAANALEVYREALALYKAELQGDAPTMTFSERWTNDIAGTYAKRMADYEAGIGALSSAQIVTGHKKTGLFGWGKGKDLYSGVLDVYPQLIDAEGRLDTAMAETILSTHKMDDATRNLIQSLIDLQDQADAAQEELRNYLKETFGSLGDGIMDSITDAIIHKGNDAWETFGKSGAKVLEDLGQQLAYSLFFAKQFDKLQEQLEDIYGSGKSEEQIANDAMKLIGNFYQGIGSQMDAAQDFLEEWKRKAGQYGVDLWSDEEDTTTQSGRTGAITSITQDQANSIDGRLASGNMHWASIDNKLDDVGAGLNRTVGQLAEIADNTAHCGKRLDSIDETLTHLKNHGLKAI